VEVDDAEGVAARREGRVRAEGGTSELDERRRDRGDAAAGRERAAAERDAAATDRDQSQAEADQRRGARAQAADDREHAAAGRDEDAADRDRSQAETDQPTSDRDRAGEDREHAASDREESAFDRGQSQADADQRTSSRGQAARDRDRAAAERQEAASGRAEADRDYAQTRANLRLAQLDQLTGAFGRGIGMLLLEQEINRAHHGNGQLVLAYIDVDGLKQVNDRLGHGAGDGLLRDVADAIQTHLRSYDTLVRVGGDEFVCALGDCTPVIARSRFQAIRATLQQTQPAASISVGLAALRPEDTLEQLTKRGDLALYEAKRNR
jgi:diguanylate cyclase (GGDEF)-like protein